jgi:ribosomal protein L5
MTRCAKIRYGTEREALDALKKLRRTQRGKDVRTLNAYRCSCGNWHLGHARKTTREIAKTVLLSKAEVRHLRNLVADVGRKIANEDRRALQRKLNELGRIVEEDRLRAKAEQDAAEFQLAIIEYLRKVNLERN